MNSRDISIEIKRKGLLIIISGPSGVGKNTVRSGIFDQIGSGLKFSVSHTTRPLRKNEQNGIDYYFINRDKFYEMIKEDKFAEWAEVHQNFYGTTKDEIDKCLIQNHDLIMDVDIKGCKAIKAFYQDAITIFIMPPTFKALEERLRKRGIDNLDLRIRLIQAEKEISEAETYDYIIINDQIGIAIDNAVSIIKAERCRNSRNKIEFKKGE